MRHFLALFPILVKFLFLTPMTFKYFSKDFSAGFSVFLVALPLCLGIALASGTPLFSGLLAGIVGGVVVSLLSGSEIAITGPAAGLIIIIDTQGLGGYSNFLTAVVLAGAIQFFLGWFKMGRLSSFVPSSVINGMLVAIGIVIILKQIPHALGWNVGYEEELKFIQSPHKNTFTEIIEAVLHPHFGAIIISIVCLLVIVWWEHQVDKKRRFFKIFPAALVAVVLGVLINQVFYWLLPSLYLGESNDHMVQVPMIRDMDDVKSAFHLPSWEALGNSKVYLAAFTIAIVASMESLFGLEAADKLDKQRRISSPNQELKAQGVGNFIAGLIGALPLTVVIVRTSVSIYSGSRTRLAAFIHGLLILVSVVVFPTILNYIPLACLAALLILVGSKLIQINIFRKMYLEGYDQFVPFIVTIVAIILTDLLIGVLIGVAVGISYVMYTNSQSAISVVRDKETILIWFKKDISFLNKARLKEILTSLKSGDYVFIDGLRAHFIDHDIYTTLKDFKKDAPLRGIQVEFKGITRRKITKRNSNAILQKTSISE